MNPFNWLTAILGRSRRASEADADDEYRLGVERFVATGLDDPPDWFDGPGFIEDVKTDFVRLWAAWDQEDFNAIRRHASAEVCAALENERMREFDNVQDNEVVRLDAELLGVGRDGRDAVACVRFVGSIENQTGSTSEVRENWHMRHDWDLRLGPWRLQCIERDLDQEYGFSPGD